MQHVGSNNHLWCVDRIAVYLSPCGINIATEDCVASAGFPHRCVRFTKCTVELPRHFVALGDSSDHQKKEFSSRVLASSSKKKKRKKKGRKKKKKLGKNNWMSDSGHDKEPNSEMIRFVIFPATLVNDVDCMCASRQKLRFAVVGSSLRMKEPRKKNPEFQECQKFSCQGLFGKCKILTCMMQDDICSQTDKETMDSLQASGCFLSHEMCCL